MLKWCYDNLQNEYDLIIVFANTGKEHEGTLKFVKDCEENWNIPIVWIESRHKDDNGNTFSKKGWKTSFKVVDFDNASRNGEPFEEMISVLGIPCSEAPFCSDQLKRTAIESYLKSIGWNDFYKAIGIRCDEIDRVNDKHREKKIIYPLVSMNPMSKKQILWWWKEQDFDLNIPSRFGNCDNCWKKSMKILTRNATKNPESFDWWRKMEEKYQGVRNVNTAGKTGFFRGNKSTEDIFKLSELESKQLDIITELEKLDGCSESCEVY